jgi:hypothetical protein
MSDMGYGPKDNELEGKEREKGTDDGYKRCPECKLKGKVGKRNRLRKGMRMYISRRAQP